MQALNAAHNEVSYLFSFKQKRTQNSDATIKYRVFLLMETLNPTTDDWLVCLYVGLSCSAICGLRIFEMKWALVGNGAEMFPAEEPFSKLKRPCGSTSS